MECFVFYDIYINAQIYRLISKKQKDMWKDRQIGRYTIHQKQADNVVGKQIDRQTQIDTQADIDKQTDRGIQRQIGHIHINGRNKFKHSQFDILNIFLCLCNPSSVTML